MKQVILYVVLLAAAGGVATADPVKRRALGAFTDAPPAAPVSSAPTASDVSVPSTADSKNVKRAQVTSDVRDHEPVDNLSNVADGVARVFYFTEVVGMAGKTLKHRWELNDRLIHEQPMEILSGHYRAHTSKTMGGRSHGKWKVSLVDSEGNILSSNEFSYGDAAASAQ